MTDEDITEFRGMDYYIQQVGGSVGTNMSDYGTISDAGRLMVTREALVEMWNELKRRAQEFSVVDHIRDPFISDTYDDSPSLGGQNKDMSPMLGGNRKLKHETK